ncbi:MAG: TrbI F-type domain-containing protein [Pseudomonadota bacterium]
MTLPKSILEIATLVAAGLSVIALAVSARGWNAQPKIVSVSVKTLIEEERDWLLARGASEESASRWIDTVATEIEGSLISLEAQGYIVLVKEAVLAGDIPDLTDTVRASLGVRERQPDPVSRSTNALAVVSDEIVSETTAQSFGDRIAAEARGVE